MLEVMRGIRSVGECMCGPGMNEVCVKERESKENSVDRKESGRRRERDKIVL